MAALAQEIEGLLGILNVSEGDELAAVNRIKRLLALRDIDRAAPPQDNTLRNMAAQEAFRNARVDRDRRIAKAEINDDEAFVRDLRVCGGNHAKVALFISSVARFAGELQHSLIHPDLRKHWSDAAGNNAVKQGAIRAKSPGGAWDSIVDPGLAGNAHMVCSNIATAYPTRLPNLSPGMIINHAEDSVSHYFSAAVAARWRANAVFNAGVYKTGKQQEAVSQSLREAIRLFANYRIHDGALVHAPQPPPPATLQDHIRLYS